MAFAISELGVFCDFFMNPVAQITNALVWVSQKANNLIFVFSYLILNSQISCISFLKSRGSFTSLAFCKLNTTFFCITGSRDLMKILTSSINLISNFFFMAARITNYTKIVKSFLIGNFFCGFTTQIFNGAQKKADGEGNMFIYSYGTFRIAKRYVHILLPFLCYDFPLLVGWGGLDTLLTQLSFNLNITTSAVRSNIWTFSHYHMVSLHQ